LSATTSPKTFAPQLHYAALALALAVGLPWAWSLTGALLAAGSATAWSGLATDVQTPPALWMAVWTGMAATALAWVGAAWLLAAHFGSRRWTSLLQRLPAMLAVPHAAFAIGAVVLLAPSGVLVRWGAAALAPLAGPLGLVLDTPPAWRSTQDPWGLGLIAVLVLKEVVFLLWAGAAHLQRPDVAHRLGLELRLAQTLGYNAADAWWRVAWPQLQPRMLAPLVAVLAYSIGVVDVALVIGPTTPAPLAVLAWQWLQDADPAINAQGAAAAWLLAAVLAVVVALGAGAQRLLTALWSRPRWSRGPRPGPVANQHAAVHQTKIRQLGAYTARAGWHGAYFAVLAALAWASVASLWPFPDLWPQAWSLDAWDQVARSSGTLGTTVWLGLASASAAVLWCVAWFECAPTRWQQRAWGLVYLPLALPAVLWTLGLHRLALDWGIDASAWGLWLAHSLCALPYVALVLHGPYSGFDPRLRTLAATLSCGPWPFVWRVKWPLLRGALAAAFAVGFAVSVAQYLPTLYVGAGRYSTVGTEALALSGGGQRSLMAAYAALLWLLPAAVFGLATWVARPRQWATPRHNIDGLAAQGH